MGSKPMTQQEPSKAWTPDWRASLAAMQRAAQLAHKIAMQTDTKIVVVCDVKLMRIVAKKLLADATAQPATKGRRRLTRDGLPRLEGARSGD